MSRDGWRPHIESALALDLSSLFAKGALFAGSATAGNWFWSRDGERVATISYLAILGEACGDLTLKYTWTPQDEPLPVTCNIRLSTRPLRFGGFYWYMHCPYTHRRARKLYKFNGIEQFCHRTAIRPLPTYASQRVSGVGRVQHRRWSIRRRIGDDFSSLLDEPFKPKWMRWHTFNRYAARDALLAEREDLYLSPFMRRLILAEWGG